MMRNQYLEQKPDVEELITSHMELVRQIAWHMHGRVYSSIEIEDLIQIGYFGLVTAAQNYTLREGATFASYAGIRIRGAIVDHLRKSSNLCRTTIEMQKRPMLPDASFATVWGVSPHRRKWPIIWISPKRRCIAGTKPSKPMSINHSTASMTIFRSGLSHQRTRLRKTSMKKSFAIF